MDAFIEIHLIVINEQRVEEDHVEEFVEMLEDGRALPPITVREVTGRKYRIVDGRHRLEARRRFGQTRVRARITP